MGIKRNEIAEPQWQPNDYAKIDKENLFSDELWKRTINWNLMLEHVKKTESACQPLNGNIYPSRLFTAYIDMLEANMFILNDIFYYETGIPQKPANNVKWFLQATHYLRFWNMDWYKEMKMIYEGLYCIENHLIRCLKQKALSDIFDEIYKKSSYVKFFQTTNHEPREYDYNDDAYSYACNAYRDSETDKNALIDQILTIVNIIEDYKAVINFFINKYGSAFSIIDFDHLVTLFRNSYKGENFIKPWRRDFEGSRDSLIVKMEKDPELGPWVNRYTHLKDKFYEKTAVQLFCDDDVSIKNIEETFNTDNWIRLLTIAAILQEYDERQETVANMPDMNKTLIMKLSIYFKNEDTVKHFLKSIYGMNDKQIIRILKNYKNNNLCSETSKDLWKLLHDANLYKTGYSNWNAQLNKQ